MIEIGDVFGRLTVTGPADELVLPSGQKKARCRVKCECGVVKVVHASSLRSGNTQSCGCLCRDRTSAARKTHGMFGTSIYNTWGKMIQRCSNPKDEAYTDYGGRGIKVCPEWASFERFYADMGDPPEGKTLDRENNDGPYSAANCKWSTGSEQANNRRSTVILTHNGVSKPLTIWASEIGIHRHTLANRIRCGWSTARALTEPLRQD